MGYRPFRYKVISLLIKVVSLQSPLHQFGKYIFKKGNIVKNVYAQAFDTLDVFQTWWLLKEPLVPRYSQCTTSNLSSLRRKDFLDVA